MTVSREAGLDAHDLSPGANGPVVVLVHGLEDGWESWRPLAGRLGSGWRLRALDLPWRAGNRYGWRSASAASWVARGLELVGEPVDALVAHSFGANATLELMAGAEPWPPRTRPAAVALAAPFFRPADMPITWEVFDRSRENFHQQIRAGVAVRLGRRTDRLDSDLVDRMADMAVDRIGPAGFFAVFDQFVASGDLELSTVDIPTLVLAGGRDPGLGRRRAQRLAGAMPAATVVLREEYDHFCHVRQADDVAQRIGDFLRAGCGRANGAGHVTTVRSAADTGATLAVSDGVRPERSRHDHDHAGAG